MKNKILSAVFLISLILLILTISIGAPIYLRFFYYLQIEPLGLIEKTGYSYEKIKYSYDCVLDYLTIPFKEFSVGELKFSEEGRSHFEDCKKLFNLNAIVLISSLIITVTIAVLHKLKKITLVRIFNRSLALYAGVFAIVLPVILAAIIAVDFNKAFKVFHAIFFPGKDNWLFTPSKDEIINILPQQFFMNCAIFIGVTLVVLAVALIVYDIISHKKRVKEN